MDRVMKHRWALPLGGLTVIGLIVVAISLAWQSLPAAATSHSGTSTGFAFGAVPSAGGVTLVQGEFANHSTTYCPSDPAASWSYGTLIYGFSPTVSMIDDTGASTGYTAFNLWDIGDFACNKGNYWADLYFGRWKPSGDACSCNNGSEVLQPRSSQQLQ